MDLRCDAYQERCTVGKPWTKQRKTGGDVSVDGREGPDRPRVEEEDSTFRRGARLHLLRHHNPIVRSMCAQNCFYNNMCMRSKNSVHSSHPNCRDRKNYLCMHELEEAITRECVHTCPRSFRSVFHVIRVEKITRTLRVAPLIGRTINKLDL